MHFGFKPYLNLVFLAVLPLAWVVSGRMSAGLQSRIGVAWVGFIVFACLSIPFSYWRSGSISMMWGFIWRDLSIYFWTCSFVASYKQCRQIMFANAAVGALVLLSTIVFSDYNSGGRLGLSDSFLLANANDLAMHLLLDMGFFYYMVLQRHNPTRILGGVGMVACLYYLLKTGSRGGLVALAVFLLVLFFYSTSKVVWAMVSIPILGLALAVMPSNTLHRFTMILMNPDISEARTDEDIASIESQQERQELMKRALHYVATRPLTGVGPGEFIDAVWTDEHREGKHPPALGTHNTYLEVASELGLPAFFCYVGIVLACIVMNYRTFQRVRGWKDMQDGANMAYCLLAICAGFAVTIFFHHMTYTAYLPLLSALTLCVSVNLPGRVNLRAAARRRHEAASGAGSQPARPARS